MEQKETTIEKAINQINEFKNKKLLPEDFHITSFFSSTEYVDYDGSNYIKLCGRSGDTIYRWHGHDKSFLDCMAYQECEKSDKFFNYRSGEVDDLCVLKRLWLDNLEELRIIFVTENS